jgi:hypothetical protein
MNARRLVIAVPLAAAVSAAVYAAVPAGQHHSGGTSHDPLPDANMQLQPVLRHPGGSGGHRASSSRQRSRNHDSLVNGGNLDNTASSMMANVDYTTGPYGAYDSAALHDSWVQGVIINVNWRAAEPSPGTFNFAPLDSTATAWADAGKRIVIVVRATNEIGGGCSAGIQQYLPGWEITALHNAMGSAGTFCDQDVDSLVPDWFSSTFQSNFLAFISALGAHVSARPYYSSITYVRIGDGLGGEGFFLFPQNSYEADRSWMETHWGYSPQAWENFQETMLAGYRAAFPRPVQIIYPIAAQDDLAPNDPVDLAVAEWATNYGGIGISEECLGPGGLNNYADFATIDSWVRDNHPNTYIEFQTCGQTTSASEEQGIIEAAEGYGAKSIEWYQNTIVSPPSVSDMAAYQTWENSTFGS